MEGPEKLGCEAVGGELDGTIIDVEEFGAEVAFPEGVYTFISENISKCSDGAIACSASGVQRVGEGMDLKLEPNFEDVKGCYAKSELLISLRSVTGIDCVWKN